MKYLQQKIKYNFKNKNLLETALTHSSYANEKRSVSNERLEFLGDSVLSLVTSEYLFKHYRNLTEGSLTKLRAALVCERSLCSFAMEISLGSYLFVGKGEDTAGARERPSTLADAFEALIAAIYLDGGLKAACRFIHPFIEKASKTAKSGNTLRDYKTALQEIVQQNPSNTIEYVLTGQQGPDHNKLFFSQVLINNAVAGKGSGHTKKEAEQNAAHAALFAMDKLDPS